jgi:hypothetical protein
MRHHGLQHTVAVRAGEAHAERALYTQQTGDLGIDLIDHRLKPRIMLQPIRWRAETVAFCNDGFGGQAACRADHTPKQL